MAVKQSVKIGLDVHVEFQQRGDHWAAYMEPFGVTVYGATQSDVKARIEQAVDLFARTMGAQDGGVELIRQYLDSRGVKHTIKDIADPQTTREYSSTIPMEALVYA